MALYDLILSSHPYLSEFDYDHYPENFAAFSAQAEPLLAAASGDRAETEAAALLDALARRYEALPRRERKNVCYQDRQILALFLTPAALSIGEPAADFARTLHRLWTARFPREPYELGEYEKILRGFDATLLGIPLRKSKKRR